MRCGCTSPCPACPQAIYLDMLTGATPVFTLNLTTTPTILNMIVRPITIPAALPGLGFTSIAEWNALAGDDQNEITASWEILLDGVVQQVRFKQNWQADEAESMAIIAGRNNLSAGNHEIIFQMTAAMENATGQLFIHGGAMRTELVRADNLVVTGGL